VIALTGHERGRRDNYRVAGSRRVDDFGLAFRVELEHGRAVSTQSPLPMHLILFTVIESFAIATSTFSMNNRIRTPARGN